VVGQALTRGRDGGIASSCFWKAKVPTRTSTSPLAAKQMAAVMRGPPSSVESGTVFALTIHMTQNRATPTRSDTHPLAKHNLPRFESPWRLMTCIVFLSV